MIDNGSNIQTGKTSDGALILIAEDNEQVRKLAEIILTQNGYRVLTAENGLKALEIFASEDQQLQLLLTDLNMPELNGTELYARLKESHHEIRVIYMSGYSADILGSNEIADPFVHFIQKPFTIKSLLSTIQEALEN